MKKQSGRWLWVSFFLVAVCGGTAGMVIGVRAALLAVCCVAACVMLTAFFDLLRGRKLKELALDMDRLLHGDYRVRFKNYEEGETAVVANELAKITDTLQTQAEKLKNEKKYLADSIADISHQIRTPLTALNLTLETLEGAALQKEAQGVPDLGTDGKEDGSQPHLADRILMAQAEKLKQAKQLTRRMEWLIEALLKLAKLDAGTIGFARERVSVRQLVHCAAEPFCIPMELRAQNLDLSGISPDATFCGDMAWSTEALGNVLKNCVEHTGVGGTIWISAKENAIYTELVVEDNGEGIDEEDLPHLFERFYKGKNSGGNSVGIGLALTRAILMAQNGTVQAENRREGGARFVLRIYKGIV